MLNYSDFSNSPRSQKIILAKINSVKLGKSFSLVSGEIYQKQVAYYCYKFLANGVSLTEATSQALNPGEFYYNPISGILYVRMSDGSDPKTKQCLIGYQHFYSNIPVNIAHDLNDGVEVNWDARIKSTGELKLEIDYEQTGIAIESDSNISLENNDGYFDEIFDTHIFDNQEISIWSWTQKLPPSEAKLIYRGKIKDKAFTSQEVRFNIRDQIKELRKKLVMPLFSSLDGDVSPSVINKPKRLILGKAKQLKTEGIDKVLDGYLLTGLLSGDADRNLLTGTLSGLSGSNIVTGSGTLFTTELVAGDKIRVIGPFNEYQYTVLSITSDSQLTLTGTISVSFNLFEGRNLSILNNIITGVGTDFVNQVVPNDSLKITINEVDYKFTVETVNSATNITLSDEIEESFLNKQVRNEPQIPYRRKNRVWSISGHKLRQYQGLITLIEDSLNIEINSIGDIEEGDLVDINGEPRFIDNISGVKIRINQSLPVGTVVGDAITKVPVPSVFLGQERLIINRDYLITNTTEAKIVLNELAEFNLAKIQSPVISFQFTNGSNTVNSLSSTIDLTTVFQPRDWIRSKDITLPLWFEIRSVSETSLTLISPWTQPSISSLSFKKSPQYASDDSLVTCDCIGLESGGQWIKNASNAVKWLLGQASITNIDNASFDLASGVCDFTLSAAYPESIGGSLPEIKQIISSINESVFGSLFLNDDFQYSYQILNADRPLDLEEIRDDDIISFQVNTRNNISSIAEVNFRKFTNLADGANTSLTYRTESQFTQNSSQNFETVSRDLLLYKESDAQLMAQRLLFFRSLSQTLVTITSGLNLALKSLNDRVFINLSRIFKRFGSTDRRRIGIINAIYKDGYGTKAVFNDLGNIFNRVGVIAPNTQANYSASDESDIVRWAYVVDNQMEVPDASSEKELGNNLIG